MAMDRKPENGSELKTSSCGQSAIITGIQNAILAEEKSTSDYQDDR